ncbi:MAG: AraC family transcriptional regulator [Clostridia bacterium]|nr:AraC family transcriptional regulator [Clostridia bacterium]
MNCKLDEGSVVLQNVEQPFVVHLQSVYSVGECASAHLHNYIEMLFCLEGEYEIWLNSKYFRFSKGDLVVINSREIHRICSISDEGGKYICTRFLPDMLYTSTSSAFDMKYVMPFMLNSSNHQRVFKSSEIENTFIPYLMHEICSEFNEKKYGYEMAVKTDISRIFLWIVRYWHNLNLNNDNTYFFDEDMIKRMQLALDFIAENYGDDIKASEVADICNLSYSYFSRIFKQYMKKSFTEYLNYIRITNAEKQLISGNKPITEIAVECGFTTSSYFIQQFKRVKGMSPKQFRKALMAR